MCSLYSAFFSLGQTLCVYRHGSGIFQRAVDEAVALMEEPLHAWVHVFPEGKVYQEPTGKMGQFKWGISRLILEPEQLPIVVPIYSSGFDSVMPLSRQGVQRFIPRLNQSIRITFGKPLVADQLLNFRRVYALSTPFSAERWKVRSDVAAHLQLELYKIKP